MSRNDFSREEFAERLSRTRQAIADKGLDWVVLFHPVSIHWLTGSDAKSFQAFQCLIVGADDDRSWMLTRESERAEFQDDAHVDILRTWGTKGREDPIGCFKQLAQDLGLQDRRVGIEVPSFYLSVANYLKVKEVLCGATVTEATALVADLKMVKSPTEISYIREAARISDQTVAVFTAALRVGQTEAAIAAEIYHRMLAEGGSIPPTAVNFVSGERAAFSHGAPTHRVLQRGDTGNAEYCVAYRRYPVSIGRQFSLGPPSQRLLDLYQVAREAGDAAMAAIRDGQPAAAPYRAARRVIEAAGLEEHQVHIVGYGLAPAFPPASGDPLALSEASPYTLKAGMNLSVCPPIFIADERIGVRIVDNVLVTANGCERLSKTSRDLIVID